MQWYPNDGIGSSLNRKLQTCQAVIVVCQAVIVNSFYSNSHNNYSWTAADQDWQLKTTDYFRKENFVGIWSEKGKFHVQWGSE